MCGRLETSLCVRVHVCQFARLPFTNQRKNRFTGGGGRGGGVAPTPWFLKSAHRTESPHLIRPLRTPPVPPLSFFLHLLFPSPPLSILLCSLILLLLVLSHSSISATPRRKCGIPCSTGLQPVGSVYLGNPHPFLFYEFASD